jgi:hypothetical protein
VRRRHGAAIGEQRAQLVQEAVETDGVELAIRILAERAAAPEPTLQQAVGELAVAVRELSC